MKTARTGQMITYGGLVVVGIAPVVGVAAGGQAGFLLGLGLGGATGALVASTGSLVTAGAAFHAGSGAGLRGRQIAPGALGLSVWGVGAAVQAYGLANLRFPISGAAHGIWAGQLLLLASNIPSLVQMNVNNAYGPGRAQDLNVWVDPRRKSLHVAVAF